MKKTFILILFLVAALAVLFTFYSATERKNKSLGDLPNTLSYISEGYSLRFDYPKNYYLKERSDAGTLENPQHAVVLVEDTQINRDVLDGKVTEPMEGPVSIMVDIYFNPQNLSPADWLGAGTNWIKNFPQDPKVLTVDGVSGLEYIWDGLYAGKSVIITRGSYAYVFSVTWIVPEDQIIKDFEALLDSVIFR